MKLKMIKHIAFTILFLLGMVSAAWGSRVSSSTMTDPTADFGLAPSASFSMSGQVNTQGGNESWTLNFQWDQGTGTWTDIAGSGALYTNDTNPITGNPTSGTITVVSDGTTGTYQIRVNAKGSVTGEHPSTPAVTVTVSGGSTTTTTTTSTTTTTTTTTSTSSTTTLPSTCTIYVDGDNGSPSSPYSSWATAATDISTGLGVASAGDKVCVRASTATYGGFTPVDGVTVTAEYCDPQGTITRPVVGNIDFNGDYTSSPNQTIVECMDTSLGNPGIYISAKNPPYGIDNNTILRYNWITASGKKPGIKHENGAPVIEYNTFTGAERPAIRIYQSAGGPNEALVLRGNTMYNDSSACGNSYCSEIFFDSYSSSDRYVLIQDNIIYDTDATARAGINFEAGTNNAYITGNQIYDVNYAGIHVLGAQNASTKIIISGETSFTFAGTSYTDGSPNEIYSNGRGGINTENTVIMDIISNDIHDNDWGGISTDKIDTDGSTYVGYSGPWGATVLDIRKNYIHGNGAALNTIGGGINARQVNATIKNNVIYKNNRAGIRVGDYVTEISNNTVVSNGSATDDMGGGITYDNTANSVLDAMPSGTLASAIPVINNVIAYTEKAALIGLGFTNTVSSPERDYNLIYSNNPGGTWMTDDCGYVAAGGDYSTEQIDFRCLSGQYGFQPLYWDNSVLKTQDPNDILDDPVFVSTTTGSEDYQLDTGSPGIGTGCYNPPTCSVATDMGAWGGAGFMDWVHGLPH